MVKLAALPLRKVITGALMILNLLALVGATVMIGALVWQSKLIGEVADYDQKALKAEKIATQVTLVSRQLEWAESQRSDVQGACGNLETQIVRA